MQKELKEPLKSCMEENDADVADVLIAISVVSRQLAKKVQEQNETKKGEKPNEQNE